MRRDPELRRFVSKHLDESIPGDRVGSIVENIKTKCPPGEGDLCVLLLEQ
jgi:hypothetical protein